MGPSFCHNKRSRLRLRRSRTQNISLSFFFIYWIAEKNWTTYNRNGWSKSRNGKTSTWATSEGFIRRPAPRNTTAFIIIRAHYSPRLQRPERALNKPSMDEYKKLFYLLFKIIKMRTFTKNIIWLSFAGNYVFRLNFIRGFFNLDKNVFISIFWSINLVILDIIGIHSRTQKAEYETNIRYELKPLKNPYFVTEKD